MMVVFLGLCVQFQFEVQSVGAVIFHQPHDPVAEGRQMQEVGLEDLLAALMGLVALITMSW